MANVTKTSGDYISNRAWFRDVLGGKDLVLCHTSALEHLQLFVGYMNEKSIDVYAKKQGEYDNINYRVVNSFDGLDIVNIGNVLCTTFNQTINDILSDFDNADEQALAESLSRYYHANGKSFSGLAISPENMKHFEYMKDWAIDYYNEGMGGHDTKRATHVQNHR
ncbi:MAG: hypothetical protein FWG70_11215 [Oscillospiraceae bacterium]|nr:hypothetical protein [Oscillospiraceae bacterium]